MISLYENATHLIVTGEPAELRQLSDDMRFRPNGYAFSDQYTRYRVTNGREGWDGWSYPLKISGGVAAKCLRGRRDEIIALSNIHGFKLNLDKLLSQPFKSLHIEDVRPDLIAGRFQLDEYQRKSIHQWLVHGIGISHTTVGGGKTATFSGAAVMLKEKYPTARIIYITASERLVRQAFKDIRGFAPQLKISQFGGGKKDETGEDMVVCTTAMLNRHYNRLRIAGFFSTFIAIFYDEVQHAPSATSVKILESIPAFFRFGATDSIKEASEERQGMMIGLFGAIRNRVESHVYIEKKEGQERARLAQPHIYLVDIKSWQDKFKNVGLQALPNTPAYALQNGVWQKGEYLGPVVELDKNDQPILRKKRTLDEKQEWTTVFEPVVVPGLHRVRIGDEEQNIESRWVLLERLYDRAITRFKERNELIVQWVSHFSKKLSHADTSGNGGCLVVCTRTLHIYILEALIKRVVNPDLVRILFSKDTSAQRDACFEWFKQTPGSVLITPLVKEGVSINEIRAGVVADYVADFDLAKQITGRLMRPKFTGDNRAELVWFVDNQAPTYRRGCNTLFRQLESVKGFKFYHPCSTPESVQDDLSYDGASMDDACSTIVPSMRAPYPTT